MDIEKRLLRMRWIVWCAAFDARQGLLQNKEQNCQKKNVCKQDFTS